MTFSGIVPKWSRISFIQSFHYFHLRVSKRIFLVTSIGSPDLALRWRKVQIRLVLKMVYYKFYQTPSSTFAYACANVFSLFQEWLAQFSLKLEESCRLV